MSNDFLTQIAAEIRYDIVASMRLDKKSVSLDIEARRHEANAGLKWACKRTRIKEECEAAGITEARWTKSKEGLACSIQTMRRRVQLIEDWSLYEPARLAAGDNGLHGIIYALSLIQKAKRQHDKATNAQPVSVRSDKSMKSTGVPTSRCHFITGDSRVALAKLPDNSVSVIVTSPPYWPAERSYGGIGIGFEPTIRQYIDNLMAIFRECYRVLKPDGVMWIVIGDSYSTYGGTRPDHSFSVGPNGTRKVLKMDNEKPDTTAERPAKNLLGIPWRLAFALQEEGWILRQEVIWNKGFAHPELVKDRCTRTHETVFMFSKLPLYFYDADAIRVPAVSASHARGQPKPGLLRRDADSEMRTNPIGRNSGTVWEVNTISYPGPHTATFPPDLVRMVSCDDDLLVLDPFGGAGTTAMVALELGHHAITIDINPEYTEEARARLGVTDIDQAAAAG